MKTAAEKVPTVLKYESKISEPFIINSMKLTSGK